MHPRSAKTTAAACWIRVRWAACLAGSTVLVVGTVVVTAALWLLRAGRAPWWSSRCEGVLAAGALTSRALSAFSAPVPAGVSTAEKVGQNTAFALLVLVLMGALVRRHPGTATVTPWRSRRSSSTGAAP